MSLHDAIKEPLRNKMLTETRDHTDKLEVDRLCVAYTSTQNTYKETYLGTVHDVADTHIQSRPLVKLFSWKS